jgi:hypothetical protein
MKNNIKPSTALLIGGLTIAVAFVAIAIFSPGSLDRFLHPGDERNPRIKEAMERQQGSDSSKREEKPKSDSTTPSPSPEEPTPPPEATAQGYERIPKPECISRDQVVRVISASEEARQGRVIEISGAADGSAILVSYRKKTFLGIGSGENQIEGILRRGLRRQFPDRFVKSLTVRSAGTRSVRQGGDDVKVEVLEIKTLQTGCGWL